MELATARPTQVARPLHMLVPLIKSDLEKAREASHRAGVPHYRAAGEKMIEARPAMTATEFEAWTKRNFSVGRRQALEYMNLARHNSGSGTPKEFTSIRDAVHQTRNNPNYGKPPTWHDPVRQAIGQIDIEALKQDALAKQQERALQRKLSLSLIDIGYKALATKLHPDKGGSREAMSRLNRVRDILRGAVTA